MKKVLPDGSIKYSGFCMELLERLAKDLKFSYTIYETPDQQYGQFRNGKWNGMIREILDGVSDNFFFIVCFVFFLPSFPFFLPSLLSFPSFPPSLFLPSLIFFLPLPFLSFLPFSLAFLLPPSHTSFPSFFLLTFFLPPLPSLPSSLPPLHPSFP